MSFKIEKSAKLGFCFGVSRTIDMLEKFAREQGNVVTLGAPVHNQQVLQRLASQGITVAESIDELTGAVVAIGAHGVNPEVEERLRSRHRVIINTTCPFVQRAQIAARKLAKDGFSVIVYGEADHPEVKGILGWADGKGAATLDEEFIATLDPIPRHIGILSQTTQLPEHFIDFVNKTISRALVKDSEIRIIDTICHDIRDRQTISLELARRVDLVLVIGSHTSANTRHLVDLCSSATSARLVETAKDIQPSWLHGCGIVGVTAGASTSEDTINKVLTELEKLQSTFPG